MKLTAKQVAKKKEFLSRINYYAEMIVMNQNNTSYVKELASELSHYYRLYIELVNLEKAVS